ncbi:hypothetical protein HPB48_001571 [Haemaphysalis longicornis]|uniref:Probable prefoldin subunit 6 n=1 Tax=Haemaphysalis longicornis TaxID=44386 RepID=A0A9J6FE84_HAELO|nr:hypothetical protein HPB48_001571 [Haemaphysalis longicornis]
MEAVHKALVQEVEKYKSVQKDFQKTYSLRQKLDSQLNENSVVKEELDLLESGAAVFKLIGPVLIKQGLDEAKQNVNKRIDYITSELYVPLILLIRVVGRTSEVLRLRAVWGPQLSQMLSEYGQKLEATVQGAPLNSID